MEVILLKSHVLRVQLPCFFNYDLSMKYITIGAAATVIEFSNGTIIDNPNKITLPHIGSNYLLYISKSCHFGVIVHDAAK